MKNTTKRASGLETRVRALFQKADIEVNGTRPWDIQVHDTRLYSRALAQGNLGFGEAYMDGWWDVDDMAEFFSRILKSGIHRGIGVNLGTLLFFAWARFFNLQTKSRAFIVGEEHYDVGNDLYKAMLDKRLVYTCGYWSGTPKAQTLEEAQEAKLDLICRKLNLKKGDRVLDIGCGWGSFLKFAAEKYGVEGVGITVSKEQVALAQERCAGLPIEIRLQDYRDVNEQFDHIISIGMFEHVGYKNYRTYMEMASRCLKDDGLFLLHTIGGTYTSVSTDPWIDKYIFPNGMLPSITQLGKAFEGVFVMEDWHNFGPDYDLTLQEWYKNFNNAWPTLKDQYSERFYRMWRYYLLSCSGAFRARENTQLWQIVLSKHGVPGGYKSIR